MRLDLTVRAAVMGLCFSVLASGNAQAYTFTKIADTSGSFSSFFGTPAINNGGTVAFGVTLDVGGRGGFFISDGTGITTVFKESDNNPYSFVFRGGPSINNKGTVAFGANLSRFFRAILTGGGPVTTITTISGPFVGFDIPSINDEGNVAFSQFFPFGTLGIFTSRGGPLTTIATFSDIMRFFDEVGSPDTDFSLPSINNGGTVAFQASITGSAGIFTGTGGPLTAIATTNDSFSSLFTPSINDVGTVAFRAGLDAGGEGIFTSRGGSITTIADSSGAFSSFRSVSINNGGMVAFEANLDSGGFGIFTGTNSIADKVVAIGDPLFGSTVTFLGSFGQEGLNDAGHVAFFANLADGTSGIFRAEPEDISTPPETVPEPASTLGLLAFGALGAGAVLKRQQKKPLNSAS